MTGTESGESMAGEGGPAAEVMVEGGETAAKMLVEKWR